MYFNRKIFQKAIISIPLVPNNKSRNNYNNNIFLATFIIVDNK